MHPFRLFPALGGDREAVAHVNALDDQHIVLGLDLTDGLYLVALRIDFDLTRLQRAGERARQSPPGSGHDIVQRRGVRRVLLGPDAIVLGDLRMHAKHDRSLLSGQVCEALRAAEPLDPHPRDVGNLAHGRNCTPQPGRGDDQPRPSNRQSVTTARAARCSRRAPISPRDRVRFLPKPQLRAGWYPPAAVEAVHGAERCPLTVPD
jgi:hypothetical protein